MQAKGYLRCETYADLNLWHAKVKGWNASRKLYIRVSTMTPLHNLSPLYDGECFMRRLQPPMESSERTKKNGSKLKGFGELYIAVLYGVFAIDIAD